MPRKGLIRGDFTFISSYVVEALRQVLVREVKPRNHLGKLQQFGERIVRRSIEGYPKLLAMNIQNGKDRRHQNIPDFVERAISQLGPPGVLKLPIDERRWSKRFLIQ